MRFPSTEAARAFEGKLSAFVDRRGLHDVGPHASRTLSLALLPLAIPYGLVVPGLAGLAVVVGAVAGAYPALLLSRFPAAAVLARRAPGGRAAGQPPAPGGGRVPVRAAHRLHHRCHGAGGVGAPCAPHRSGVPAAGSAVVRGLTGAQIDTPRVRLLLDTFRRLPGVLTVGLGTSAAGGGSENDSASVSIPGLPGEGPSLRWIGVGRGFFAAYGPRLLTGRVFDDAHGADDSANWAARHLTRNVVINRKALAVLEFHSPQAAEGKTSNGTKRGGLRRSALARCWAHRRAMSSGCW